MFHKSHLIIEGKITLMSPLNVKMAVPKEERGWPAKKPSWGAFPEQPVVCSSGETRRCAIIEGTTIRGRIRRLIAYRELEKIEQKNRLLTVTYEWALGQSTSSSAMQENDPVAMQEYRAARPIQDLFGIWKCPARLSTGIFTPYNSVPPSPEKIVEPYIVPGVRRDLDDDVAALLPEAEQERLVKVREMHAEASKLRSAEKELKALDNKYEEAKKAGDEAKMKEIDEKRQPLKEIVSLAKGSDSDGAKGDDDVSDAPKNSTKHIRALFAMPTGTELWGKWIVKNPTTADVEMLKYGFDQLSLYPMIGGNNARGFGEIACEFDWILDGEKFATAHVGGFEPMKWLDLAEVGEAA